MPLVLPLLALAAAHDASAAHGLEAVSELVAAATVRPAICVPMSGGDAYSLWSRIGYPGGALYCKLIAGGMAHLRAEPAVALAMASRAERLRPTDTAAPLLVARALAAMGAYDDAWAHFAQVMAKRGQVEGPNALHDLGVTALATGHYEDAAKAYRMLVPRAALLGDELRRQKANVEGAVVLMHQGERGVAEAGSYLTELRRGSIWPGLGDYVVAALGLALDREGRSAEARGVIAEAEGPWGLATVLEASLPADTRTRTAPPTDVADTGQPGSGSRASLLATAAVVALTVTDLRAMVAVLAEAVEPEFAAQQWEDYLREPPEAVGPWALHAERKLHALRRKSGLR